MSRLTAIACTAAIGLLFALPAAAPAAVDAQGASAEACRAEQRDIGKRAFRKRYGAKKTMRKCIRKGVQEIAQANALGVDECTAELEDAGLADFLSSYGVDYASAFAECVAEEIDLELSDYFPLLGLWPDVE